MATLTGPWGVTLGRLRAPLPAPASEIPSLQAVARSRLDSSWGTLLDRQDCGRAQQRAAGRKTLWDFVLSPDEKKDKNQKTASNHVDAARQRRQHDF